MLSIPLLGVQVLDGDFSSSYRFLGKLTKVKPDRKASQTGNTRFTQACSLLFYGRECAGNVVSSQSQNHQNSTVKAFSKGIFVYQEQTLVSFMRTLSYTPRCTKIVAIHRNSCKIWNPWSDIFPVKLAVFGVFGVFAIVCL